MGIYKVVVKTGLFTVTLEQPKFIERGQGARFKAQFEHVKDGLIDPTTPLVKFFQGDAQQGTNQTPTKDSKGVYYLDFDVSATQSLGPTVVEWSGTYSGNSIKARAAFGVVKTVR